MDPVDYLAAQTSFPSLPPEPGSPGATFTTIDINYGITSGPECFLRRRHRTALRSLFPSLSVGQKPDRLQTQGARSLPVLGNFYWFFQAKEKDVEKRMCPSLQRTMAAAAATMVILPLGFTQLRRLPGSEIPCDPIGPGRVERSDLVSNEQRKRLEQGSTSQMQLVVLGSLHMGATTCTWF